jgi:hypothetical protein
VGFGRWAVSSSIYDFSDCLVSSSNVLRAGAFQRIALDPHFVVVGS